MTKTKATAPHQEGEGTASQQATTDDTFSATVQPDSHTGQEPLLGAATPAGDKPEAGVIPIYPRPRPLLEGEVTEVFHVDGFGYIRMIGRWVPTATTSAPRAFLPSEKYLDGIGIRALTGWGYATYRERAWLQRIPGLVREAADETRTAVAGTRRSGKRPPFHIRVSTIALVESLVGNLVL